MTSDERGNPPQHGFLAGGTFATYHPPSGPERNVAYVICPPLGYEAIECYHSLLRLAQGLAGAGFATVRIEYHGTGESLGTDEDPGRVAAWLDSIRQAVATLRDGGVEAIGLIGLRLGATFAAKVAAEIEIDRLVLWHPCISGAMYTREVEIMASAAAKALGTPPLANGGLEAAGYLLTSETMKDLSELKSDQPHLCGRPEILVVDRDDRPAVQRLGPHYTSLRYAVTVEKVPGYKEMMIDPAKSQVPTEALARIRDWAVEHSRSRERPSRDVTLQEEIPDELVRRRAVRFGPNRRLLGIVTEPVAAAANRPGVILLAGGIVPRTAVNRMYVPLARRLAGLGHRVLRVDIAGIGESSPAAGAARNDPYADSLLDDVVTSLRWISSGNGSNRAWLVGLCSGAYASFQTALTEQQVLGVVLINPLVFYWKKLSAEPPTVHDTDASKHYGRSLLSPAKWRKLIAGKVDLRYAMNTLAAPVRNRLASRWGRDLPGDLSGLLSRGVAVNLAFSEGDPGYDAFVDQVGRRLSKLQRDGLVLRSYQGADHTFSPLHVRGELLDWIVDRVCAHRGSND
ncbi:MAG: alpha/beta fold hydrolase [Gemmatimonadales bacterium]